jgi:signal transduction histidine kinase
VWADRDKAEQILIKPVGNTVKFTPAGGQVTVSARVIPRSGAGATDWILVPVVDTEPDIPAEAREAVLNKFYSVRRDGHDRTPGAGLGLSISKSLVELHEGRIWMESEVGRGKRFVFTLPCRRPGGNNP